MHPEYHLFARDDMIRSAVFGNGPTGPEDYRYELIRLWSPMGPRVNFIMLNPSTADDKIDDPTIRRCLDFAMNWGYGSLVVTNLFALRSTNPRWLKSHSDPIGPENDSFILKNAHIADRIICAWGVGGKLNRRGANVLGNLRLQKLDPAAIHLTADGTPSHPLYLPSKLVPESISSNHRQD